MNGRAHELVLSHGQLVSLYVQLSRHEEELDRLQAEVLETVAAELYGQLSVSEMEQIDVYYRAIAGDQ